MATVIGDYRANHSSLHTMIAAQGLPYSQDSHYPSTSRPRDSTVHRHSSSRQRSPAAYCARGQTDWDGSQTLSRAVSTDGSGASRLPSPPDSCSPSGSAGGVSQSDDNPKFISNPLMTQHGEKQALMDSAARQSALGLPATASTAPDASTLDISRQRIPRPAQNNHVIPSPTSDPGCRGSASQTALDPSVTPTKQTIKVRDMAHVQALARTEMSSSTPNDASFQEMRYDLSECPIADVIEMVAALLTKITTTNEQPHNVGSRNVVERNATRTMQAQTQNERSALEYNSSTLGGSILAFHGKNVPAITISSYLSRIHKYCPTTFEVFLSLLVYFDRMTERVNEIVMKAKKPKAVSQQAREQIQADTTMKDCDSGSDSEDEEVDEDLADEESDIDGQEEITSVQTEGSTPSGKNGVEPAKATEVVSSATRQPTFFVVDNFNIHRLIIAGITCASKFFSDVFYTNSRYAKVGGLPLAELNHLEIQFLLLNDFRLAIQVEDLQAYATMLIEFYTREVVSCRSRSHPNTGTA